MCDEERRWQLPLMSSIVVTDSMIIAMVILDATASTNDAQSDSVYYRAFSCNILAVLEIECVLGPQQSLVIKVMAQTPLKAQQTSIWTYTFKMEIVFCNLFKVNAIPIFSLYYQCFLFKHNRYCGHFAHGENNPLKIRCGFLALQIPP